MAAEQMSFDLYPNHEHKSCKGCCHLEKLYRYVEERKTYRLKEIIDYCCDLSPWGYRPIGAPKRAQGCPPNIPERYETDYLKGHPWGQKEVKYA